MGKVFTSHQKAQAVALWRSGRDTAFIAWALGVPESEIYNGIPAWRETVRGIPSGSLARAFADIWAATSSGKRSLAAQKRWQSDPSYVRPELRKLRNKLRENGFKGQALRKALEAANV